jgi:hypothetical protein
VAGAPAFGGLEACGKIVLRARERFGRPDQRVAMLGPAPPHTAFPEATLGRSVRNSRALTVRPVHLCTTGARKSQPIREPRPGSMQARQACGERGRRGEVPGFRRLFADARLPMRPGVPATSADPPDAPGRCRAASLGIIPALSRRPRSCCPRARTGSAGAPQAVPRGVVRSFERSAVGAGYPGMVCGTCRCLLRP